jgi:hypothetical protein
VAAELKQSPHPSEEGAVYIGAGRTVALAGAATTARALHTSNGGRLQTSKIASTSSVPAQCRLRLVLVQSEGHRECFGFCRPVRGAAAGHRQRQHHNARPYGRGADLVTTDASMLTELQTPHLGQQLMDNFLRF